MTIVTNRKILQTHNTINQTFIPSHNYSPLGSPILLPSQELLLANSPMAISYLNSTTVLGVAQWQGGTGLNIQPFYTDTRPPLGPTMHQTELRNSTFSQRPRDSHVSVV